jgi:hypothetical protein
MNKIHLMVDKTLHRKLKVQHELNKTEGENQKVSNTIQIFIDTKKVYRHRTRSKVDLLSWVDKNMH